MLGAQPSTRIGSGGLRASAQRAAAPSKRQNFDSCCHAPPKFQLLCAEFRISRPSCPSGEQETKLIISNKPPFGNASIAFFTA